MVFLFSGFGLLLRNVSRTVIMFNKTPDVRVFPRSLSRHFDSDFGALMVPFVNGSHAAYLYSLAVHLLIEKGLYGEA